MKSLRSSVYISPNGCVEMDGDHYSFNCFQNTTRSSKTEVTIITKTETKKTDQTTTTAYNSTTLSTETKLVILLLYSYVFYFFVHTFTLVPLLLFKVILSCSPIRSHRLLTDCISYKLYYIISFILFV